MRFMRLPLYVGFGITLAAAVANAETSAAPSQSDHHFLLEFQETEIEEAGPIRDKLISDGVIAGLLADIENDIALPMDIPVTFRDCGMENAYWNPEEKSITYCYEIFKTYNTGYDDVAGEESTFLEGVDRDRVLTATTLFLLMHELGHGAIDIFSLPATGREEDAADQLATLLMIRADEKGEPALERPSRMALIAAYWFKQIAVDPANLHRDVFADEHALGQQRYYDIMCLVFGSDVDAYEAILMPGAKMVSDFKGAKSEEMDPDTLIKTFALIQAVDSLNILPFARSMRCEQEYQRYSAAWDYMIKTFMLKHE